MNYLLLLMFIVTACGQSSSKNSPTDEPLAEEKAAVDNETINSIALDTKADLPDCEDSNKSQLAYIIDEDKFYVCSKEWTAVSIKGKDGIDGSSSNSLNQWTDSISGKKWLLMGTMTFSSAQTSCANGYRTPTIAEGTEAINHGIRLIAANIGATTDFWTNYEQPGVYTIYMTVSGGSPSNPQSNYTATKSAFCVKD